MCARRDSVWPRIAGRSKEAQIGQVVGKTKNVPKHRERLRRRTLGKDSQQRQEFFPKGRQIWPIQPTNLDPRHSLGSQAANGSVLEYFQVSGQRQTVWIL